MKKILKAVPTILVAVLAVGLIYYFASGSYKHISAEELALMLTEKAGIETEDPMAVLSNMGVIGENIPVSNRENLNNEQAFSVVSRFFLLNENDGSNINYVTDSSNVEKEYKLDISGLLGEEYIKKGRFRPKSKAKYNDVSKAVDKILGKEYTDGGNIPWEFCSQNISLKGGAASMAETEFPFSFVMCGDGATLDLTACEIKGHIAVVSGNNTIVLDETVEVVRGIYVMKGASCRIVCTGDTKCKIYSSGDLDLQGNAEIVTVLTGGDVTVNGNVQYVAMKGAGYADYQTGTFGAIYSKADGAAMRVAEGVTGMQVSSSNEAVRTLMNVSGKVERVETESPETLVNIKPTAEVGTLTVYKGAEGTQVVIEKGAKTESVTNEEEKASVIDQRSKWDGR